MAVVDCLALGEAISLERRREIRLVENGVETFPGFGLLDVPDGLQRQAVIEPVRPFQSRELDRFKAPPVATPMDDLGVVEAVDQLGERFVVRSTVDVDGGFAAGFDLAVFVLY